MTAGALAEGAAAGRVDAGAPGGGAHELEGASGNAPQPMAGHPQWPLLGRLPLRMTAGVPLRRFTLRSLVELQAGQLLRSGWVCTEDIPLRVGAVALGWCEFEVVEGKMAVRLTRLA